MTTSPAASRVNRILLVTGAVLLTGLSAGVATGSTPTPSIGPGHPGSWVVYQSSLRDREFGPEGIFLIRLDGSADHEIATDLPGEHVHPAWSHDGQQITFAADIDGARQLAVVDADGSGARLIGHCAGTCLGDDDPALSPDARRVAYTEASSPFIEVGGDDFPSRIELRVGALGSHGVHGVQVIYRAAPRVALDEPHGRPTAAGCCSGRSDTPQTAKTPVPRSSPSDPTGATFAR